jgi:hypothetical protein
MRQVQTIITLGNSNMKALELENQQQSEKKTLVTWQSV